MVHSGSKADSLAHLEDVYLYVEIPTIHAPTMNHLWPAEAFLLVRGHLLESKGNPLELDEVIVGQN